MCNGHYRQPQVKAQRKDAPPPGRRQPLSEASGEVNVADRQFAPGATRLVASGRLPASIAGMTAFLVQPRPCAVLAISAAFAVSACAGSSADYPSLAIRDAEIAAQQPVVAPPPAPTPTASAQVMARLASLTTEARKAHAMFQGAAPVAARLVRAGAGSPPGTDPRSSAEIALSDLRSLRSETSVPLADLDAMLAEASNAFEPTAEIAAARDDVKAMIDEEDRLLTELRGLLAS